MTGWDVEHRRGSAADLHGREVPDPARRSIWVLEVDRPALVLGSTQPESVVDRSAARAAGVEVVRRRTGGGAVLLEPGGALWVDVVVPRGDALWDDDVSRSSHWLGGAWVEALAELGVPALVHRGGLCTTDWSRLVCFGGLGPGEVVEAGGSGRKIVGVASRRSRGAARFQTAVHVEWAPERLLCLLALAPGARERAGRSLAPAVATAPAPADRLVAAVIAGIVGAEEQQARRAGGAERRSFPR
ncbi:MAG: hypothetical protein HYX34_01210 [Actinobacteria bacterium]|nr:hypothetical protein [Actinomycetota bacterium]